MHGIFQFGNIDQDIQNWAFVKLCVWFSKSEYFGRGIQINLEYMYCLVYT